MKKNDAWGLAVLGLLLAFLLAAALGVFHFDVPSIKDYHGFIPSIVALAAIVDSINPCAFSVLFLTTAFLFSINRRRRDVFVLRGPLSA